MGKEEYKEKIIEMVTHLSNERYIKMIFGFVKKFYENEMTGN